MRGRTGLPTRRALLGGTLAAAAALAATPASAQGGAVVISRERILREAAAARRLREAEEELTSRLQSRIDDTKAAFAAEEAELARLRGTLSEPDFEARVTDFDQRVRLARRGAQERAALLQKEFQDARSVIAAALPPLMERLRVEAGATVVLNADYVLAVDPAVDLTDRAIALFDAEGPSPAVPELDLDAPLSQPLPEPAPGPGQTAPARDAPPR